MEKTTPENMDKLIDLLSDKIVVAHNKDGTTDLIQKPVMLGDALAQTAPKGVDYASKHDGDLDGLDNLNIERIIVLWGKCGFTRSLQDIVSCGYETYYDRSEVVNKGVVHEIQRLRSPQARALCEFLLNLFPNQ